MENKKNKCTKHNLKRLKIKIKYNLLFDKAWN